MNQRDPAKRVPKSLGTETKLIGRYTLSDVAVALFPGVIVVLLTQTVLPSSMEIAGQSTQSLTLPLAVAMVVLGTVFVYLTPEYTTSIDWIATMIRFRRQSTNINHEAAREYTQIERVYPDRDAIERTDGAFVGLVEVVPPSMALATDGEWAKKVESFQDFLNTTVEFPLQIFSTTQAFPIDEYLAHYEARLEDPDVRENPRLRTLIEEYVEWYRQDLEARRMTIREHYVVVSVTPEEIHFEQASLVGKLAKLPLVGLFLRAAFAPRKAEERAAMLEALDDRLERVAVGLREVEGCDAHPLSATEAATLVGDFWAGTTREYGDLDQRFRTRPVAGRGE